MAWRRATHSLGHTLAIDDVAQPSMPAARPAPRGTLARLLDGSTLVMASAAPPARSKYRSHATVDTLRAIARGATSVMASAAVTIGPRAIA